MSEIYTLEQLADLLFKDNELSIEEIEAKYPKRDLPADAKVTRIAPSPTGFMHIGSLYAALISERMAHQSNGIFFLRIEDTDKKREVEGAIPIIVNSLANNGIKIDEGEVEVNKEVGNYGPYKQSNREQIYKAYVKKLVEDGLAYPCFCTEAELEEITKEQIMLKIRPGYYGKWAVWAHKSTEEMIQMAQSGKPFVIRLRSSGDESRYIQVSDLFKGDIKLPENDQDIVLLKSNGLPTYHFAHIIDDHLMQTTHVVRGDEWLSSLTLHLQMFKMMGWEAPVYGHIAPIQKLDGASRRKLSKRKDPESNVEFYADQGYPSDAVISYLLNLANSSFEAWRKDHPTENLQDYQLKLNELRKGSGALLDLVKLNDLSKDLIANYTAEQVYNGALKWAKIHDTDFAKLMEDQKEYTLNILSIERGSSNARKDIAKWADVKSLISYFYDSLFENNQDDINLISEISKDDIQKIAEEAINLYNANDTKDEWLIKMRNMGAELGFAPDAKTFKADPSKFKGNFGTVAMVLRVLLTGRLQSPDLYEVMKAMGQKRITQRLKRLSENV